MFIENRKLPLCDVPEMTTGNRPADGGKLIIEAFEYEGFIKKEPEAKKYIRRLMGSKEFISNEKRYCLWLVNVSPSELRKMPEVMKRVELCREDRLGAKDLGRRKLAERPTLFRETLDPETGLVIPCSSSEKRYYVPMGFIPANTILSNAVDVIPGATIYHFGILTSSVHMAWVRAVAGRLKSDYRYSNDLVYNNFPWPDISGDSKERIAVTAQGILDARELYPDCSLAILYDESTMPPELRKAHQANDKVVMAAYGYGASMTEPEIVVDLMQRYQVLVSKEKQGR
jgi:hypothetical protein